MACPFDNDPVDEGAALLRRELNIRREMIIRPGIDVLAFLDNYLFERYRFTSQSIIYIHNLIRPYICNITNRSHALTSQQILCVALHFIANGSFLYNVGDAEHLSKETVCRAVRDSIITSEFKSSSPPQQSNKEIIHISFGLLYFLQIQELVQLMFQ